MKHLIKNMEKQFMVVCLLFWLAGFCGFFIPTPAICDNSAADEIISLDATDRPLGEVLEKIALAADCQFSFDASWEDYPITASFNNEPLSRGLKLILRNINNAVIYGTDRTVRIIIYDEGTPSGKATGHPVTIKSSQESDQQSQPFSEATAPQPEVEVSEDGSDAENVEQQPQEIADSDTDSNEAGAENTKANEEESSEAAPEEKTGAGATEQEQVESGSEQESSQTEETESTSGGSENSEKRESSEESNAN